MTKNNYKKRREQLEADVNAELVYMILTSEEVSKFVNTPTIDVFISNVSKDVTFVEMVVIDDKLVFIDSKGQQYSSNNVGLTDLIDLVDFLNDCITTSKKVQNNITKK